ncbi:MAG: hypothetical protein DMF51_06235, partial [Acidobacteria bacterium]
MRPAFASTVVQLTWDANTETDLAGYRIQYGTTSGNYTGTIDVGNVTSYAVPGLVANTTYYFVVVAYDLAGNVSGRSNEVSAMPTVLQALPTVAATDAPDPVAAGANLIYTLSYSNTGNVTATGVVISDTVPANTAFVSATGGGTLSGSATYAIVSNESQSITGPAVTTTVMSTPVLTVVSADAPDPVAAGASLTYTLSYTNTGNANATAILLTDTIPANTAFVSAGSGTLSGSVVTWSIGSLAAGASGTVQLVVRVASPLANGTVIHNQTYSVASAQTAAVNGVDDTTTVTSAPVLAVSASDAPDPVAAGANLTYTLSYSNTGSAGATGVILSDTVPGSLAAGVVTWSIGSLAAGASGSVQLVV